MKYSQIKELREDSDIGQKEIAKFLKISRSAYANYENGLRNIPIEILSQIADYHKTSVDFLIGKTDIKEPYPHSKKQKK